MACDCLAATRVLLCLAGLALSALALHVEIQHNLDPNYEALCDFSETISCSKVFSSRWGSGFGLVEPIFGKDSVLNQPNSIFGLIFYTFVLFSGCISPRITLLACMFSCVGSLYLAYILTIVLKDACVVCIGTYFVNIALLTVAYFEDARTDDAGTRRRKGGKSD